MGTTADITEIVIDSGHPTHVLVILCRVRVRVGMTTRCRGSGNGGPVLVEATMVVEDGLLLGSEAKFFGNGGHVVDLVVDNNCQPESVKLDQAREFVFGGVVCCHVFVCLWERVGIQGRNNKKKEEEEGEEEECECRKDEE